MSLQEMPQNLAESFANTTPDNSGVTIISAATRPVEAGASAFVEIISMQDLTRSGRNWGSLVKIKCLQTTITSGKDTFFEVVIPKKYDEQMAEGQIWLVLLEKMTRFHPAKPAAFKFTENPNALLMPFFKPDFVLNQMPDGETLEEQLDSIKSHWASLQAQHNPASYL